MSIDIHNGYKLTSMDISELQTFCMRVRAAILDQYTKLYAKQLANDCAHIIDMAMIYPEDRFRINFRSGYLFDERHDKTDPDVVDVSYSAASIAFRAYQDRALKIQRTQHRDPEIDLSFNFTVIPNDGNLYALVYTEKDELLKVWESFEEVTSYAYYNHSDPPEGISRLKWEARLTVWDEILQHQAPALRGFNVECVPVYGIRLDIEELLPFVPSLPERVRKEASDLLLDRKFQELRTLADKAEEGWDTFRKVQKWMKSEEGKSILEALKDEVSSILIPALSKEHLQMAISNFMRISGDIIGSAKLAPGYKKLLECLTKTDNLLRKKHMISHWISNHKNDLQSLLGSDLTHDHMMKINHHLFRKINKKKPTK